MERSLRAALFDSAGLDTPFTQARRDGYYAFESIIDNFTHCFAVQVDQRAVW